MQSKARSVKRKATTDDPSFPDKLKKKILKSEHLQANKRTIKMEDSKSSKTVLSESQVGLTSKTCKGRVSSKRMKIIRVKGDQTGEVIPIKSEEQDGEVDGVRTDDAAVGTQHAQNTTSSRKVQTSDKKQVKKESLKSHTEDGEETGLKKKTSIGSKRKVGQVKTERKQGVENVQAVVRSQKNHRCSMFVGAHVSAQGGVHKSVPEAAVIGASSFALFLRNQRQWNSKPLDEDVAIKFKAACIEHNFSSNMILPHSSYLMNLGSPDPEKLQKSRDLLVDELHRCERLGLTLYNFHPGSTCGETSVENCLHTIAESINIGHSQSKYVITVLENMSGQGNTIGGRFEDLRGIIDGVKDKCRVGVCLDTCHAFAAGFDLATENGFKDFVKSFDDIVGSQYLKAMHINDSKGIRGSHRDLHENIGKGKIGLKGFSYVMNEPMFRNIPMILETPAGVGYDNEIKLLHSLCRLKTDIMNK